MLTLVPISGNINDTTFTVSANSIYDYYVNWGDGGINPISQSHVYTTKGIFNVQVIEDCGILSAFTASAFSPFFEDSIFIETSSVSAYTGCLTPFNINLSASTPNVSVSLYASGSQSFPNQSDTSFWQHLTPEWTFYDSNLEKITSLDIDGTPVFVNDLLVGYSALSTVFFKDDIPNDVDLFFTISKKELNVPINSRVYAAFPFSVQPTVPTKLKITLDGLSDMNSYHWADIPIPVVITASDDTCSSIIHYASGSLIDIQIDNGCYGISVNSPQFDEGFAIPCFSDDSAIIRNTTIPSSSFLPDIIIDPMIDCGENPLEEIVERKIQSPQQITLTASAIFDVGGTLYTLTGQSVPFDVYRFEDRHAFYRKGEDITLYDLIKKYSHFDLNQLPELNEYLEAIAGSGDTFGKVYDKTVNFSTDHVDIDLCQVNSIYDIASKLDETIYDFGLEYPEELRRVMNLVTIPTHKLVGVRPRREGKIGQILKDNDLVSEGETIAFKTNADDYFTFYESPTTTQFQFLSTIPHYENRDNFCYYRWTDSNKMNIVDSVINYNDPKNKLDPTLIDFESWFGDDGVVEEMFNYILTKNLLNS